MLGWTAAHIPLFLMLPALLAASGFFSGSETALFGLSYNERMTMSRRGTLGGRAVDSLLREPRMLLITVLLGNMVVNVLYLVICSVLLLNATEAGVIGGLVIAAATVVLIILVGEVIPKLIANAQRMRVAGLVGPPILAFHRILLPVRRVIDAFIVVPLSRLTAPQKPAEPIQPAELESLLHVSMREGLIDEREQQMLQDVLTLGRTKVYEVMTPRIRMAALPVDATRDEVVDLARSMRLTKLPVYQGDLDHIVGILHVKRFLLEPEAKTVRDARAMTRPRFIPEIATLDSLLDDFRRTHTQLAIAVDEYGGTSGIIAVEDIVEEIVGELHDPHAEVAGRIEEIDRHRYRVEGDVDVRDLEHVMFHDDSSLEAATVAGLIAQRLGRTPEVGDVVDLPRMSIEVEEVSGTRVSHAIVRRHSATAGERHPNREDESRP